MIAAPLVSVITPNYNGERFIRRAVESVRRQNYSLEHIIVDDNSIDGSWDLLIKLACEYPWLRIIRLDKNSGPVIARNRAIELSRGRFLAFLDVDDFWLSNKLDIQIKFMLDYKYSLTFTDYRFVSEDGKRIGRRLKGFNRINWHLHHMTRYLGCLTIVLDRNIFSEFKFPDVSSSVRAEDFLAWSHWIQRFAPAVRCPHDLARYAVVDNSRSSSRVRASRSVWHVYRDIENIPLIYSVFYFIVYAVGVFWKRYWNRPYMDRKFVEMDCDWSILLDFYNLEV